MRLLPAGYLEKKGRPWRAVKTADIMVLIYHVFKGAEDPEVGFEDAGETIESLMLRLNKKVLIDPSILESALWSCNLMQEQGKWWDPQKRTWEQYLRDVLGTDKLHPIYNTIEKRD